MTGRTASVGPRRTVAALAALVLVGATAACYSYSGARYGGPDAPLQARLASTHGGQPSLNFAVSDRAHVALFRVHDSGYARALYPYHLGSSSVFTSGPHTVLTSTPSFRHGWSPLTRFTTYRRGIHGSARGFGFGRVRISYVLLVASRRPLRMSRIRDEVPFRYRPVSALATPFYGGTAFGTMDRLIDRLIPEGLPREDWDVDWVVSTDYGAPFYRPIRPPFRRIASRPEPSADDTTSSDRRRKTLDTEDVPFNPPRIPIDLPEVTSVDGGDRSRIRVRVPLPPADVTPVPRVTPGEEAEEPPVGDLDGLEGERRPEPLREDRGRRPSEAGSGSDPGPSEHFGRLFGADDRREAEGWIPGWSGDHGRTADRRVRRWTRELTKWANDPDGHEFPEPPRPPPARWRGGSGWQGGSAGFDRPAHRIGDLDDVRRVDPPTRPNPGRDIEVRRPSSTDRGGDGGARKSDGGSGDDRGGG